mmetsp:Transcript_24485/g.40977  ORF Transcript_24485/g.40977 Transcript_24485/m.40977 type:complete len:278 (-) Transcript_24485:706-1539(-)
MVPDVAALRADRLLQRADMAHVGGPGEGVCVEAHGRVEVRRHGRAERHGLRGAGRRRQHHVVQREQAGGRQGGGVLRGRRRRVCRPPRRHPVALVVHQRAQYEHRKPDRLQVAVLGEALPETGVGEPVEEHAIHRPHKQCARGLEDGPEHGAQVVRHTHPGEVVAQHGTHLCQHQHGNAIGRLDELERVQRVLLAVAHIGPGEEVHRRQHHHSHHHHAVHALQTHHLHGFHVEVGHEVILERELNGLHHLGQNHQSHAKDHIIHRLALLLPTSAKDG